MRVLVLAYACEPEKGSEPGVGWMWCRLLTRLADVTVITRANNRAVIESGLSIEEAPRLRFEYVDLPAWAMKWKRGGRGARLYYILWQFAALRRARSLVRKDRYDLTWHVTLANAWLGSTLCLLRIPYVFGPVSGGVPSCWRVSLVGARGLVSELARSLVRNLARLVNPLARLTWRRAELILTNNEDTLRWLPRRHHRRSEVFPNVVLDIEPSARRAERSGTRTIMYAGYLLPLKGLPLALHALTHLEEWRLDVYGDGPDKRRLEGLARDLDVADRVRFLGWTSREKLFEAMSREAEVLIFPSLHDEVGWVVAEAVAHGLPAVCLDRGGPRALGGISVELRGIEETARALARKIDGARVPASVDWSLAARTDALRLVLEQRRLLPPDDGRDGIEGPPTEGDHLETRSEAEH